MCTKFQLSAQSSFSLWQIILIINEVDINMPIYCLATLGQLQSALGPIKCDYYYLLHITISLLQNTTTFLITNYVRFYYKTRQPIYYKSRQVYYKLRQVLQITTSLLQITTSITNYDIITNYDSTPSKLVGSTKRALTDSLGQVPLWAAFGINQSC